MASQADALEQLYHRCSNASTFNCSEEEYLYLVMGPRRLPLAEIVPISAVLVVIFLTGLVGNAATCFVIVKNPSMHTATNYYLFSLSVSDLLLLLFGLPNDLAVYWHQYPYSLGLGFCKARALISEASSYGSVLTIVAFSLERYLAICHPLHLYAMAGLHRALKILAAIWLLSLAAASPFAHYTDISYHVYPPNSTNVSAQSAFCALMEKPWYLLELSSVCFFIMPGFIMLYLYGRIGLRIRYVMGSRHGRQGSPSALGGVKGSVHGEARHAKSRKAIIRMLAAVVVAFFLCWTPFHFQRLFFLYGKASPLYNDINEQLFNVAGALYYVSATVNPILYNVMSNRYRVAFRETLCCGRAARRGSRYYRAHSSFRETTVNQADGTHLLRVRTAADSRSQLRRYARSRSADTRSSELDTCHDLKQQGSALNNNVPSEKRNPNLVVNFKKEQKDKVEARPSDDSKISIEIFACQDARVKCTNEVKDISQTIQGLKEGEPLVALVGEITHQDSRTRQDLLIVLGNAKRSHEKEHPLDSSKQCYRNCANE